MNKLRGRVETLLEVRSTRFAQLSLWMILVSAFYYSTVIEEYSTTAQIEHHLSFATLLPDSMSSNYVLFQACRAGFWISALFWALNLALPVSSWAATVLFTVLISLGVGSVSYTIHIYHLTNWLMFIYCFWYQLYWRDIRNAPHLLLFGRSGPFPRWAVFLSVYFIALSYTFSGLTKLGISGIAWADGTSLQLWSLLTAVSWSPTAPVFLYDRMWAMIAQSSVLLLESTAFLAIVFPRYRPLLGILLFGFHVGNELTFNHLFYGNTLLDLLFLTLYREDYSANRPQSASTAT